MMTSKPTPIAAAASCLTTSKLMRSSGFLTAVWCLLALATPLQAARKARAIFIEAPADAAEKAILFTGTQGIGIELPQRNFSPEVNLPDGELTLAVLAKLPAKDEVVDPQAPLIHIPAAWSRCLILLFPDSNNRVFPVRAVPFNASIEQFPIGHILVFNVSRAMVTLKLGEQEARVKPGQSVAIKPPVATSGDYPVAIDCAFPGDKEVTPLCRSTWSHDPRCRQILLVTPEQGRPVPRVWGIQDFPAPAEKK
jgi:hypothetical protein